MSPKLAARIVLELGGCREQVLGELVAASGMSDGFSVSGYLIHGTDDTQRSPAPSPATSSATGSCAGTWAGARRSPIAHRRR
jgi:hypothetical protein